MNPENTDPDRFNRMVSETHDKAKSKNSSVTMRIVLDLVAESPTTATKEGDVSISSVPGTIPVPVGDGSVLLMIHEIEPPSKDKQHGDLPPHPTSPAPPPPSSSVRPVGCFGSIVAKIFGSTR